MQGRGAAAGASWGPAVTAATAATETAAAAGGCGRWPAEALHCCCDKAHRRIVHTLAPPPKKRTSLCRALYTAPNVPWPSTTPFSYLSMAAGLLLLAGSCCLLVAPPGGTTGLRAQRSRCESGGGARATSAAPQRGGRCWRWASGRAEARLQVRSAVLSTRSDGPGGAGAARALSAGAGQQIELLRWCDSWERTEILNKSNGGGHRAESRAAPAAFALE